MNRKNRLKLVSIILLLFVLGLKSAEACSCPRQMPNILDAFEGAKNVVLVKAVSIEKIETETDNAAADVKSTKMIVEKVFKGKLKAGDELPFARGNGANCIWFFNEPSIGREYLFYLDEEKKDELWIGSTCGRSNTADGAADDLLFLNNLDKVRDKSRISGKIHFLDYVTVKNKPNVEGINIKIAGNGKTYDLKTDKNGVYEIYDLPAGIYDIVPDIPKSWKVEEFYLTYSSDYVGQRDKGKPLRQFPVRLKNNRHAKLDFNFEIDNTLRGKVYDPNGKIMKGVCIRIYPTTAIDEGFKYKIGCTEADGVFSISEVPPGSYILVANEDGKINNRDPFRRLYYPGVLEREKASVINIGFGESREDLNFQIHQPLETARQPS